MHRKIPKSNRHKKIKAIDPYCRDGRRKLLDKKATKANQKPLDDDIQEVPRKLRELMASASGGLKEEKKRVKKRKMTRGPHEFGVSVDDSDVDEGETEDGRKVPLLKRNRGESVESFMRRVDSTVRTAVYETKMEIEKEETEDGQDADSNRNDANDDEEDENVNEKRNKKKNKKKKLKQRPLKSLKKKEKRKLFIKEKIASKKMKKAAERVDAFDHLQDSVPFGEVTHNPPVISANLRKCGDSSSDRRPGTKELILRNILTKTAVDPKAKLVTLPTAPSSGRTVARKALTAGDRRSLEAERERAVAAYKLLKARNRAAANGKKSVGR